MSLIDCKVTVERKTDPKGDRVLLTFEFVPFSFWIISQTLNVVVVVVENSCHTSLGSLMKLVITYKQWLYLQEKVYSVFTM